MVPRSVNLLALLMRFNSACRNRIWSACTVPIAASQLTETRLEFLAARGSMVLTTSSIRGASAKVLRASSIRAASILDRRGCRFGQLADGERTGTLTGTSGSGTVVQLLSQMSNELGALSRTVEQSREEGTALYDQGGKHLAKMRELVS